MALNDLTRCAVLRAIDRFDELGREQFLDEYGFGRARDYWLVHNGRKYDSKAIAGVAHGFIDSRFQPLQGNEFSGGDATVRAVLQRLGFTVESRQAPPSNPAWVRDEIILALATYIRAGCPGGGSLPGKRSNEALDLSGVLQSLPIHAGNVRTARFRNPEGVALKLANFRAVERDVAIDYGVAGADALPGGMSAYSQQDRAVYEEFYGRWNLLHEEATAIRRVANIAASGLDSDPASGVRRQPVESQHSEVFESSGTSGGKRSRSEATLVQAYADHMTSAGHDVSAVEYRRDGEARPLRCDAFVWDLNLLVEAKASDGRDTVRLAIGQLFDYRRNHDAPELAVLLPYEPRQDLAALLTGLAIGAIWRYGDRFRDSMRGRFS